VRAAIGPIATPDFIIYGDLPKVPMLLLCYLWACLLRVATRWLCSVCPAHSASVYRTACCQRRTVFPVVDTHCTCFCNWLRGLAVSPKATCTQPVYTALCACNLSAVSY
jgi:hypothetical protein